ncbi:hypothetical protein [uncultured Psychroserpens sp.]|uniref:hypothetical protein n=1 Tax=uncultured Psychroserpens sp. TaxID=255436 RepID=UPI002629D145|nr:hypothetical protein [uncultured Psychroserpens sp.]
MSDDLILEFCKIHIYDNYMVVTINEGVTITSEENKTLTHIADTYFKNKKFVYITHRIHSYAVDPAVYKETSKIENLVGFSVVSSDFKAKSNALVEKLFLSKPFEIFDSLEEAINWSQSILNS